MNQHSLSRMTASKGTKLNPIKVKKISKEFFNIFSENIQCFDHENFAFLGALGALVVPRMFR
jgi:hypothetical protein